MTATIRDVARMAGVSVATVSRVLTGSAPAREQTRAHSHGGGGAPLHAPTM